MRFDEYQQHDGLGLAARVAQGEVSAHELTELAIGRMDAVNPGLNAIVRRMDDLARQRATTPLGGPFAGVPFVVKDLKQDLAGVPTTCGSRALRSHVPTQHAEITRRWLAAGVVPIGLSNTPEFGLKPQTESQQWGPVQNPWQPGLSAGGSSGGSAAAVAAGIAPMAGGNDMGGSIRIPAALCGLFGFKPGRGRTPWGAPEAEILQGAVVQHVLTRSVRDSAAMLDATLGPMPGSPFHSAPPERPYLEDVEREPGRLRIGFSTQGPLPGMSMDPECVDAIRHTAQVLASLGHQVEEATPPWAWPTLHEDLMTMMYACSAAMVQQVQQATGCSDDAFELDTRLLAAAGRLFSAPALLASQHRMHQHQQVWCDFRQRHDVWLAPVVSQVRLPIGAMQTPAWQSKLALRLMSAGLGRQMFNSPLSQRKRLEMLSYLPFTPPANLLGLPAMSVPMHWTADGLPVGVQLMSGIGDEGLLFRLAGQLEKAQPWRDRHPDCPTCGVRD